MNNPWLTLITITKDDPDGLARTLASVAALRATGAEQVVIDGSATPAGPGLACPDNSGLTILTRPAQGIADAFNAGLDRARGEWVWFLNGGDTVDARLAPDSLLTLLHNSPADVVIGGITYEGETGLRPPPPRELQWPPFRSWIPHPSTLVRRRLFEQFGGFDERYTIAMDYEWWLRVLSPKVPVEVVAIPFVVFAPGGVSQRPEMQQVIRREQAAALRKHLAVLWWPWLGFTSRRIRARLRTIFSRHVKTPAGTS